MTAIRLGPKSVTETLKVRPPGSGKLRHVGNTDSAILPHQLLTHSKNTLTQPTQNPNPFSALIWTPHPPPAPKKALRQMSSRKWCQILFRSQMTLNIWSFCRDSTRGHRGRTKRDLFERLFSSYCSNTSHGKFPKADEASQSILEMKMNLLAEFHFPRFQY